MTQLLTYIGLFGVATIFAAFVLVIFLGICGALKREENKSRRDLFVGLSIIFGSPLGSFLILSWFNVYPPHLFEKQKAFESTPIQRQVDEVDARGKQLIAEFAKPESLTLQALRDLVDQAREYARLATELSQTQEVKIAQLKTAADDADKRAKDAEALAAKLKSITSEQLDAIKVVITKDATEQSKQSFVMGVIWSVPIGVLTGIISSWLWEKFGKRTTRKIGKIENALVKTISQSSGKVE